MVSPHNGDRKSRTLFMYGLVFGAPQSFQEGSLAAAARITDILAQNGQCAFSFHVAERRIRADMLYVYSPGLAERGRPAAFSGMVAGIVGDYDSQVGCDRVQTIARLIFPLPDQLPYDSCEV